MNSRDWERESIGSDESGKGDFFGGPSVVAVYLDSQTLQRLKSLSFYGEIRDSKLCEDSWIRKYAEEIRKVCRYEEITLSAKEYNDLYSRFKNANVIFSYLHDQIQRKMEGDAFRIIDAFVAKQYHIKYLEDIGIEPVKIDEFATKADSKYLSVALASIIARHNYLVQMDNMSRLTGVRIPFGNSYSSSNSVVDAYRSLLDKGHREHWIDDNLVKNNFSTLKKIKEIIRP